jgi:uncharacterized Tic20 family protein
MENLHTSTVNEGAQVPTQQETNLALAVHLSFLGSVFVPFMGLIGPLVMWQVYKNQSAYVTQHAIEALNANITLMLAGMLCGVLCFVLIGFLFLPVLLVGAIVFFVKGALAASQGKSFSYPWIVRFIRV